MQTKHNIAARAGRWSTQHRKKAVLGWLAFVLIALFIGNAVGSKQMDQSKQGVGESGRATEIVSDAFPEDEEMAEEHVLLQSASMSAGRTEYRSAVADVVERLE